MLHDYKEFTDSHAQVLFGCYQLLRIPMLLPRDMGTFMSQLTIV